MGKVKNLSIRKTIILYMAVSLFFSFLISATVIRTAEETQKRVWIKYADTSVYEDTGDIRYRNDIPRPGVWEMTGRDHFISEACDFLETYGSLAISVALTIAAVFLFYRNKLKTPLKELEEASGRIAENELDFRIAYASGDELGRLCVEFERMRAELEKNEKKMWRMIEEEKALRSAIAHDIRTPLAILQGYQEMLLSYIPEDVLEKEKIMDMLQEGMTQIERLKRFVERMRTLSGVEQRKVCRRETRLSGLREELERSVGFMAKTAGKRAVVIGGDTEETVFLDWDIVLEVAENLVSNALRYAREETAVEICLAGKELELTVRDDGSGFKVNAQQAMKARFHSNPQDDLEHSGLGMYISRVYCEKHGGRLVVGNAEKGGAVVKAVFYAAKEPYPEPQ